MIEDLAGRTAISIIVGAGVSVESGLPTWRDLLRELLDRAGQERLELPDQHRAAWVDHVLGGESPLGAAAVVEALAASDLQDWIPAALYGSRPERYQPGPIAQAIPELREAFGSALRLLTTNYDDLIEQAFADDSIDVRAVAFTGPNGPAVPETNAGHQRVSHLHGFLPRDGDRQGEVVLTEEDYQRVAQQDWQSSDVGAALMSSSCVFIGSSLTDPNLLRYLHRHAGSGIPKHYAVFTRQDAYAKGTATEVIAAREAALTARWRSNNLEIVFVDHYAEIAWALSEIARAKRDGTGYVPMPDRLRRWRTALDRGLLMPDSAFARAQDLLHELLRAALSDAVETVRDLGHDPGDEVLAATLWLVDAHGATLTNWATTDRVHRDPATMDPLPISEHSRWVAVRAFCRGAALGEPRDVYASRWHYIRGLPLTTHDGLPVGALTVSSMLAAGETLLDTMPDAIEAAFDDVLRRVALDILDLPFSAA